jgi:hypothetical protein
MKKRFRVAWVMEPGFDYSVLTKDCEEIRFILSGLETGVSRITETAVRVLQDFDPNTDVVIPVGRVVPAWIISAILVELTGFYSIGIYKGGVYHFEEWVISGEECELVIRSSPVGGDAGENSSGAT